jgi:hypothetical protein
MDAADARGEDKEPGRRSWWAPRCADALSGEDRRNLRRFNFWALAWALSFAAGAVLLSTGRIQRGPAAVAVALACAALGVVSIAAYVRFLRGIDELQRQIQLESLALGFGAGAVFMLGYRLLERAGAPALDTSDPVLVMVVVWAVGQWLARRRYA